MAFGEPDKDHDRCADVITAIASKWGMMTEEEGCDGFRDRSR
ncbi:hypothetical protein L830_1823 [Mycobacteroides abscessus MAB_082312_2258]|nr:hypothetical protein L830_1823 [Mycobacteroides abscessus MAB_082312_2258]